jgi:hypothetical protein
VRLGERERLPNLQIPAQVRPDPLQLGTIANSIKEPREHPF